VERPGRVLPKEIIVPERSRVIITMLQLACLKVEELASLISSKPGLPWAPACYTLWNMAGGRIKIKKVVVSVACSVVMVRSRPRSCR
jgi:hypothetical protein